MRDILVHRPDGAYDTSNIPFALLVPTLAHELGESKSSTGVEQRPCTAPCADRMVNRPTWPAG
jgi:hypothetical protein